MFKKLINEFKTFAMRGNVIDMAVGIIIGAAFGKIVDSLVKDIIMPPLGLLLGKVDFANLFFVLKNGAVAGPYASLDAAQNAGAITLNVGNFLNVVISFTIVAFAVFILIKAINEVQAKIDSGEEKVSDAEPTTKQCPFCYSVISIKATRCPDCTSYLEPETNSSELPAAKKKAKK